MGLEYTQGAGLPDAALLWKDSNGALIDFSSGWTFVAKVAKTGYGAAVLTKTTGMTGAVGSLTAVPKVPNLVVAWALSGELDSVPPGAYVLQVVATRTSDGKNRFGKFALAIEAAAT